MLARLSVDTRLARLSVDSRLGKICSSVQRQVEHTLPKTHGGDWLKYKREKTEHEANCKGSVRRKARKYKPRKADKRQRTAASRA